MRIAYLALVLVILTCSSDGPGTTKGSFKSTPTDFMGLCPPPKPSEAEWGLVETLGSSWVRQGFFWSSIEKKKGAWTWVNQDQYIKDARAHGQKILINLCYDTAWVRPEGSSSPYIDRGNTKDFVNYCLRVVERYIADDTAFELWNEPNKAPFWAGTKEEFIDLAMSAVRELRRTFPTVTLIGPGFSLLPNDWLEDLYDAGFFKYVDGLSLHPYWLDAKSAMKMVRDAKTFLSSHGLKKEVWITEMGFPTKGAYPTVKSPQDQASELRFFYELAAAEAVRAVFWYNLRDTLPEKKPSDLDSEHWFGLFEGDLSPKPAANAFRKLSGELSKRIK